MRPSSTANGREPRGDLPPVTDTAAVARRVAELAGRYELRPATRERLQLLVELLRGDPFAPTAIRDPVRIIDEHLADSLVALELPVVRQATSLADLGSGVGMPGLALALALPDAQFWLVESAARACRFLHRAVSMCDARNATV